jgi:hypothetical protein
MLLARGLRAAPLPAREGHITEDKPTPAGETSFMETLRQARRLVRLWLAWFGLSLAIALAAVVLHPQRMEVVCSSSGSVKLVIPPGDDGPAPAHELHQDCGQCVLAADLPPVCSFDVRSLRQPGPAVLPPEPVRPGEPRPFEARGPPLE